MKENSILGREKGKDKRGKQSYNEQMENMRQWNAVCWDFGKRWVPRRRFD